MKTHRVLWIPTAQNFSRGGAPVSWENVDLAPAEAFKQLKAQQFEAIVLVFPLPGWLPADLLRAVREVAPEVPVLVRDPGATLSDAVRLAQLGAFQVLNGDEDVAAQIRDALQAAPALLENERWRGSGSGWEPLLVGASREIRNVCDVIRLVGKRRATVLITGETGTGKELAARALHQSGPRARGPWVAVNCTALPENLLEAEMFGYVRGAFTGATQTRLGRFEQAHGGTLFLDEIGELPFELQAKLLRVLQEREFQRLGSSETVRVDIRLVAATNCDLAAKIEKGRFREDLYYRLNVVPLHMPALRERRGDIPLLAEHFVQKICQTEEIPLKQLTAASLHALCGYSWPGNVRQLENAVEMAIALSGERTELWPADFPVDRAAAPAPPIPREAPVVSVPDAGLDYEQTVNLIERSILEQALRKTGGNKKAAAEMLRLKRTTLSAKVRNLDAVPALN